jgi:acyl dehydratase
MIILKKVIVVNRKQEEMNEFLVFDKIPLEEIKTGMTVSYSQTITDADIKAFAGISGDRNPVHLDEEYAKNSRFEKRIAHGMMTASYFSALFGTKIPGEGCVYTYQSLKFKKPVYLGDTVTAIVEVKNVDLDKRRVLFKTLCKVKNKIVTDGEAELFVPLQFNKIMIKDKEELLKYKEQIFDLFEHSFNQIIDEKLWNWAYIDNPNGNPLVSLYFDKNKLVGHYAIIPVNLIMNKKNILGALSMTTMVNLSYRKYGIFITQANEVYSLAKELNYKFVFGFPNKKSAPGFKKRLKWTIEDDLYVAKLTKNELMSLPSNPSEDKITFNTVDEKNIKWRLSKPNKIYIKKENNILKNFDENFDIVFDGGDYSSLEDNKYNILLDRDLEKFTDKKEFDYIFGYRLFDDTLEGIEFKKDLIMSDVF